MGGTAGDYESGTEGVEKFGSQKILGQTNRLF
jgi:hypothetical protein